MGHTRNVGPAADIYSLGAILYEMLTGRPPFKRETPVETVRQVIHDDVVPPGRLVPKIAKDLETICLHCLNKEQPKRYPSAMALAEDLERFLAGKPIKARRTPLVERGFKLARRRPVATTLCTLGLVGTLLASSAWLQYRSRQRLQAQQEIERKAELNTTTLLTLLRAKDFLAQNRWSDAEPILTEVQARISDESGFDDLRQRVGEMLSQCRRGRSIEEARNQDEERLHAFRLHRKEALFHETQFTGLDLPGDQEVAWKSARDALTVFGQLGPDGSWKAGALPASLTQREHEEIKDGCYELLLMLAEAAQRPDQGLALLDQAAKLRPATQVYHLRRADQLARHGDAAAAEAEREKAKAIQTSSAMDQFLSGKEQYNLHQWSAALTHVDEALLIQPEHFWAHRLSAICDLQLSRPIQAKAELNACLQTEPRFAWLYELRGFASYQVAALARLASENLQTSGNTLRAEAQAQLKAAEADFSTALELLKQTPDDELQYVLLVNRGLLWLERNQVCCEISLLEAAECVPGAQANRLAGCY